MFALYIFLRVYIIWYVGEGVLWGGGYGSVMGKKNVREKNWKIALKRLFQAYKKNWTSMEACDAGEKIFSQMSNTWNIIIIGLNFVFINYLRSCVIFLYIKKSLKRP